MEWPNIGFWHVGRSRWDYKRKEEPVRILTGKRDHEVFFDDKLPIAWKAAATEFLIKALKEQGIEDIIGDRKLEEDVKYECDQCDKIKTTKISLYLHKQSKHERGYIWMWIQSNMQEWYY